MTDSVTASRTVLAPAGHVFAALADPVRHAAIDGTGWVTASRDAEPLTAAGQLFRMKMYHPEHPDGHYETVNRVEVFEPPGAISWRTGYEDENGDLRFGGWFWRYELASESATRTTVTLTYDWTATTQATRDLIGFPPFEPGHLDGSLAHLADLVEQ